MTKGLSQNFSSATAPARTSDGELVLVRSVVNQSSGHLEEVGALYAVLGKKIEPAAIFQRNGSKPELFSRLLVLRRSVA